MKPDVLVIGGGPAGAAAAIRLSKGGARVVLVERERTPAHKVCGEFLSGEALFYLERLGLDLAQFGAVPLQSVRLGTCQHTTALPFAAMSLTRKRLDSELLCRAERAGVCVRRGCQVEQLQRTGEAWQATLANGEQITASAVFLASGKHDLRGYARPAGRQPSMIAFKMYWRLDPAETRSLGHAVELFSYRGGYAGLQPVEHGLANLCFLTRSDEFRRLGSRWNRFLESMCAQSPHLRQRLAGAEAQLESPLTISSIPYGFVRQRSEGLWYLGDQAVVIPSFTGDGMSLALHTGILAAEMYLRSESADRYQQAMAKQVKRQVALATAVSKALVSAPRLAIWVPRMWPGALGIIAQQTRIRGALCDVDDK